MHVPTVSWRSKVLYHRTKDFYFCMYILDRSRGSFHSKITDTHAWIIQLRHPTVWLARISIDRLWDLHTNRYCLWSKQVRRRIESSHQVSLRRFRCYQRKLNYPANSLPKLPNLPSCCLSQYLLASCRAIAVTTAPPSASALASVSALLKMVKFLVKDFKSLYLLNLWMDLVDTLPDVSFWSEVYAIPSWPTSVTLRSRSWTLKFLIKIFG